MAEITTEAMDKINNFIADKGINSGEDKLSEQDRLTQYGLPSLSATKSILQDIHSYSPPTGSSLTRLIKNKIIRLIKNVTVSTIELSIIKQNKFNELTYQFIENLVRENQELKERISKLEERK